MRFPDSDIRFKKGSRDVSAGIHALQKVRSATLNLKYDTRAEQRCNASLRCVFSFVVILMIKEFP